MKYSEYSNIVFGTTWFSELATYVTGLVTPLTSTEATLVNTLIGSLRSGGSLASLSAGFDFFHILAGETSEQSYRNLVKRSHDGTPQNSPTWTQHQGVASNGSTSYVDLNFAPSSQGVRWVADSASFGFYSRTNQTAYDATRYLGGSRNSTTTGVTLLPVASTSGYPRATINDTTSTGSNGASAPARTDGTRIVMKNGRTNYLYRNKTKDAEWDRNYYSLSTVNIWIGGVNNNDSILVPDVHQLAFVFGGKYFVSIDFIVDAMEAYLDAKGTGVL